MILDAIYTTVSGIAEAYPLVGDIEADTPFIIFKAEPQLLRTKEGVCGYDYAVNFGIIDPDPSTVNTLTDSVRTAVLAMSGTIAETEIEDVLHIDESGIYYLDPDQVYENDLEFRISTKNR